MSVKYVLWATKVLYAFIGFGSELTKKAQKMSEFCSEEMKKVGHG